MADTVRRQMAGNQQALGALEQLAGGVQTISSTSGQAFRTVERAGTSSREGVKLMTRVATEMGGIATAVENASTGIDHLIGEAGDIDRIVGVIRAVADQTNLLALNAAIEAARAGEHGRGFAVVADEVRALAERTTQATGQIAGLVERIQTLSRNATAAMAATAQQTRAGVQFSEGAAALVAQIDEAATQSMEAMRSIHAALQCQGEQATEVTGRIQDMSGMARQSAEAMATLTGDASALSRLADELRATTSRFQV